MSIQTVNAAMPKMEEPPSGVDPTTLKVNPWHERGDEDQERKQRQADGDLAGQQRIAMRHVIRGHRRRVGRVRSAALQDAVHDIEDDERQGASGAKPQPSPTSASARHPIIMGPTGFLCEPELEPDPRDGHARSIKPI